MNHKFNSTICVLLFVPIYFLVYAFLHEAGHALVILAYGGAIDDFVFWNFNAHVSSSGGEFSTYGAALNHSAGMLLPTIVGSIVIGFYRPNVKFAGYHICHLIAFLGLLGSMIVWAVIPVTSLFAMPPSGEDVTHFLSVTRFHPLLVALGAIFFTGAFVSWFHAKGVLSKTTFKNILLNLKENAKNTNESDIGRRKNTSFIMSFSLLVVTIITIVVATHVTYMPSGILSVSGVVENVFEEKSLEYTLVIEESGMYSMNLEVKAKGFITALCIIDENGGESVFQSNGEGFSPAVMMSFGLEKGVYILSLLFLTDYEAVTEFFEDTGFGELEPREIEYINKAFSRSNNNYSTDYFIQVQQRGN